MPLKYFKLLQPPPVFSLFIGAGLLCLLLGCQNITQPKTTLKFSFWGSSEELASITDIINDYEAKHPDIDIQAVHIPDTYFQKLHILMAADLTPDVIMLNSYYLPVYAEAGKLQVIPELQKTNHGFFPQTVKALSYRGKAYAYPRDVSDLVVFVNQDLLKHSGLTIPKPNWTVHDMLAMSQVISKKTKAYGISFSDKPLFWLPFVWSFGGSLKHLNSEKSMAGLQFYADLVNKYHVAPSTKQVGTQGMSQLFMNQQLAFFISGRWSVPFLRKSVTFHWDVLPFPKGPAGSIVGVDASGYAVSAQSKHIKQAKAFAAYLTSNEALKTLTASGLILPARKQLAGSRFFLQSNLPPKNNLSFIKAIQHGEPTSVPSNWNELSEALGLGLAPLWTGDKNAIDILPTLIPQLQKDYGAL